MSVSVPRWPGDALLAALGLLQAAELRCKSTGMPDQMICRTALVQLTALPRSNVFATAK